MATLSILTLVYIALVVLIASIMRGLCGFGFSMLVVILISLIMPPAQIVPAVLIWEILASICFFPSIWKDIAWKTLKKLALGVIIGTPLGVYLLATIPPSYMIIAINLVACTCCIALWQGYVLRSNLNATGILGTGLLSGILNGACANGGLPLILLFLSSPLAMATGRASLIAFFFFTDVWASVFAIHENLLTIDTFEIVLGGLPSLGIGLWCGHKLYGKINEVSFKRVSIFLLILISACALCFEVIKLFSSYALTN